MFKGFLYKKEINNFSNYSIFKHTPVIKIEKLYKYLKKKIKKRD